MLINHKAKIAQHLSSAATPHAVINSGASDQWFIRCNCQHRIEQGDIELGRPHQRFRLADGGRVGLGVDQLITSVTSQKFASKGVAAYPGSNLQSQSS